MNSVSRPGSVGNGGQQVSVSGRQRYGCFAACIGTMHAHKLTANLTLPSGRMIPKGKIIHLDVQDVTRHPEVAATAKWHCRHPDCIAAGTSVFESKAALLKAHPDQRVLEKAEETHLFYAIAHIPGVAHQPEKLLKDGSVDVPEVLATKASVMLLSDEE